MPRRHMTGSGRARVFAGPEQAYRSPRAAVAWAPVGSARRNGRCTEAEAHSEGAEIAGSEAENVTARGAVGSGAIVNELRLSS